MTNEVGFFGGKVDVASGADIANRISESAQNDPRGANGDSLFLNFSGKKGVYTIGPDNRRIDGDEIWAVNIGSFEDGWMCWKGGRPAAARMSNIFTGVPVPLPDMDELGPFDPTKGEGWFQAKAMTLKSCDNDEQGYFKINSKSGVSSFAQLQRDIAERAQNGAERWPLVRLQAETFESGGYKNEKPHFEIVGWLDDEGIIELANGADVTSLIGSDATGKEEETTRRSRRRSI